MPRATLCEFGEIDSNWKVCVDRCDCRLSPFYLGIASVEDVMLMLILTCFPSVGFAGPRFELSGRDRGRSGKTGLLCTRRAIESCSCTSPARVWTGVSVGVQELLSQM